MALFGLIKTNSNSTNNLDGLRDELRSLRSEITGHKQIIDNAPEIVHYKWTAPARTFVARDSKFYWSIGLVFMIIIFGLAIIGELILILVLVSLMILIFVLSAVPPELVSHEITSKGIRSIDQLFRWEDLTGYYWTIKNGFRIVYINTKLDFPARLILIMDPSDPITQQINVNNILINRLELVRFDRRPQRMMDIITDGKIQEDI